MKKSNYKIIKKYLEENWETCELLMFNCALKDKRISAWQQENISKGNPSLCVLQTDLDSFGLNQSLINNYIYEKT